MDSETPNQDHQRSGAWGCLSFTSTSTCGVESTGVMTAFDDTVFLAARDSDVSTLSDLKDVVFLGGGGC